MWWFWIKIIFVKEENQFYSSSHSHLNSLIRNPNFRIVYVCMKTKKSSIILSQNERRKKKGAIRIDFIPYPDEGTKKVLQFPLISAYSSNQYAIVYTGILCVGDGSIPNNKFQHSPAISIQYPETIYNFLTCLLWVVMRTFWTMKIFEISAESHWIRLEFCIFLDLNDPHLDCYLHIVNFKKNLFQIRHLFCIFSLLLYLSHLVAFSHLFRVSSRFCIISHSVFASFWFFASFRPLHPFASLFASFLQLVFLHHFSIFSLFTSFFASRRVIA